MKLKKIASLALAGVMAVSMLTACGNTVSEQPSTQPEQPTTTNVVSAVEAGIKSWNSDLKISVKSSANMDAAIKKGAELNTDKKTAEDNVVKTLNYVFDQNMNKALSNFITVPNVVPHLNNADSATGSYKSGDTDYAYAFVAVTKTAFDKNAGDMIGYALRDLKNVVPGEQNTNNGVVTYDNLNVDYTLYVTSQDATLANNSVVTYVIAVLKADYSARV